MNDFFLSNGSSITLGNKISGGGEGDIFEIEGNPQYCAKIYHLNRRDPIRHEKIKYMVNHPPVIPDEYKDGIQLAWPAEIVYDQNRGFAGFVMRHFPKQNYIDVENFFHQDSRSSSGREFSWKNSLEIASHIAFVVAFLHNAGYRVGDLKGSNLWVSKKDCSVVFLDCDSFQFVDMVTNVTFYCTVGTPEYTPPELFGKDLGYADRYYSDLFALGTLVFQILMEGAKPYSARGTGVDDAPSYPDKIKKGLFPYGNYCRNVSPPKESLPWGMLSPKLQDLCVRCFITGHKNPPSRPQAIEWAQILYSCLKQLKTCNNYRNHVYLKHCKSCPWCDELRTNHIDFYPGNASSRQQARVISSPSVKKQISKPAHSSSTFHHNIILPIPSVPTPNIPSQIPEQPKVVQNRSPILMIIVTFIILFFVVGLLGLFGGFFWSISAKDTTPKYVVTQWNQFKMPYDITIDGNGNIFVIDRVNWVVPGDSRIQKFSSDRTFITKWSVLAAFDGAIQADQNGYLYCLNYYENLIQKYTADGTQYQEWKSKKVLGMSSKPNEYHMVRKDNGNGVLEDSKSLAIDKTGNLYVGDAGYWPDIDGNTPSIQKLSSDGSFITKWKTRNNVPSELAVDSVHNIVYAIDTVDGPIHKYSTDGNYLGLWGSQGSRTGQYFYPRDIAVDYAGNVYVLEARMARVQKFSSDGSLLGIWQSGKNNKDKFDEPQSIAVDSSNNVYVVDSGADCIYILSGEFPGLESK